MTARLNKDANICFSFAAIVLLGGILLASGIFYYSRIRLLPSMLADVFREPQNRLSVPGSVDLQLNRIGVYGIYHEFSLVGAAVEPHQIPPDLVCSLTSKSGYTIQGVQDHIKTNRYWSDVAGGPATLIQSMTVVEPGEYSFACRYREENDGPEITVSLGPNYNWEVIRLVLKNGPVIIGILLSLTASFVVSIGLILVGIFQIKNPNISEE